MSETVSPESVPSTESASASAPVAGAQQTETPATPQTVPAPDPAVVNARVATAT